MCCSLSKSNKTRLYYFISKASGSAVYIDDIPMQGKNELCAILIHSERANAKILHIDFTEAIKVDGVIGYISAQDLSEEQNLWGSAVQDEPVFASGSLHHHGQIIAAILCSSLEAGKKARSMVNVTYEDIDSNHSASVYGLGDVLEKSGIPGLEKITNFGGPQYLRRYLDNDDVDDKGIMVEGTVVIGGQQHFYLEPHNVLVVPIGEKNEYTVYVGCQIPDAVQGRLARALNIPKNKITVKIKRAGGGFGGKERQVLIS